MVIVAGREGRGNHQTDPLARRILEKLNRQETDIELYEIQLQKLTTQGDQQRKEYEAFLASLDVE